MHHVTGTEETLHADEEVWVVLAPEHSAAIQESIHDSRLRLRHGLDDVEAAADVERTALVRQCDRLLWRKRVTTALRIIFDIAARGLVNQPLAHVAFGRARALCEFGGRHRISASQRLIKPQPLTDIDERRTQR